MYRDTLCSRKEELKAVKLQINIRITVIGGHEGKAVKNPLNLFMFNIFSVVPPLDIKAFGIGNFSNRIIV